MNPKNILWATLGLGVPALALLAGIPILLQRVGEERFGLLALAWAMLAHAGLFDLGVGRSATQTAAAMVGREQFGDLPALATRASRLSLTTGLGAGLILAVSSVAGLGDLVKATPGVQAEVATALLLLAAVIPVQSLSATFRGISEALGKFGWVAAIRAVVGASNLIGPLIASTVSVTLPSLVTGLLVGRLFGLVCLYVVCRSACASAATGHKAARPVTTQELLSFGGWFTLGSVTGFALNQSERLALATLVSAAAVTAFSIPLEIVLQSLILVNAASTVAFPSLAATLEQSWVKGMADYARWRKRMTYATITLAVCLLVGLPQLLPIWLGDELPEQSIRVGLFLAVGVPARASSILAFSMLHAAGRADWSTKLRLLQIPTTAGLIAVLVPSFGLTGAAIAWLVRLYADALVLELAVRRLRPHGGV